MPKLTWINNIHSQQTEIICIYIHKHLVTDAYFLRPFLLGCRMEKSSISEESVSCRSNSWAEQDPDPFFRPFLLFEPILPFETRASSSLRFFIFLYCLTCTSSLLVGSTVLLKITMVPDFSDSKIIVSDTEEHQLNMYLISTEIL